MYLTRYHNYGDSIARVIWLSSFSGRKMKNLWRNIASVSCISAETETIAPQCSWAGERCSFRRSRGRYVLELDPRRPRAVFHMLLRHQGNSRTLAKAFDRKVQRGVGMRYTVIKKRSLTISTQGIIPVDHSRWSRMFQSIFRDVLPRFTICFLSEILQRFGIIEDLFASE